MSTAFKLMASKGNTNLPDVGRIFPFPKIFTDGFLFSKMMFALNPVFKVSPQLSFMPVFTFML